MHARAVIRGCLLACTAGAGGAFLLILGAASALSPAPPDWTRIAAVALGLGLALAVPLTGLALLAARAAARRRMDVPWWAGPAGGGGAGVLCGVLLAGGFGGAGRFALIFGSIGAATGLLAWVFAFGMRARVRFGAPDAA